MPPEKLAENQESDDREAGRDADREDKTKAQTPGTPRLFFLYSLLKLPEKLADNETRPRFVVSPAAL